MFLRREIYLTDRHHTLPMGGAWSDGACRFDMDALRDQLAGMRGADQLASELGPVERICLWRTDAARDRPDVRVMEDRFVRIEQGIAVPRSRAAMQVYLAQFLKDLTLSGEIRAALDIGGHDGVLVAFS